MRFLPLFLIVAATSTDAATGPVGATAVWNPPEGFLAAVHAACDRNPPRLVECFRGRMRAAGASPEALAFTERAGGLTYLRAFRDGGRVDVAWAVDPFRANTNDIIYLVNGDPAMIDVDDPKYLTPSALEHHPAYAAMRRAHPKVMPFPGDRHSRSAVARVAKVGGGPRFVVGEELRDGCHACAVLGTARVAFDFDSAGRFRGAQAILVQAMPAPQP
jgi:hypothetical protein